MKKISKIFFLCSIFLVTSIFSSLLPKKIAKSRDPFYLEEKTGLKKSDKKSKHSSTRSKKILLEGIMQSGKGLAAVLSDGQESEVVAVGSHYGDYVVKKIDRTFVVLVRGKKTKKLELD